jgi:hypothetical protein
MFVVWSGFGWLVPVIMAIFVWGISQGRMTGPLAAFQPIIGLLLCSVAIWSIGSFLNYKDLPPFTWNKPTRDLKLPAQHSFYYIRMELWAAFPLAVGLTILCVAVILRLRT